MCARGRGMFAVLIVLLGHLLQLVLALAVFCILVLLAFPRRPVLPQALQLPKRTLRMCATRLDVLQNDGLDLIAHAQ